MTGLYIARITVEAMSPLSVGSGEAGVSVVSLVRDANGLPMIAGASLQGLIKALAKRDRAAGECLFGDSDNPGKIRFSDARIHGGNSEAVSGVMLEGVTDPLLQEYLVDEPLKRDHVKIDHRGAGDDPSHGKFDRSALPRGTRLSFELTMWGGEADRTGFLSILSLVHHGLFRPGGATRRGYGRVKVIEETSRWKYWPDPRASVQVIDDLRRLPFSKVGGLLEEISACSSSGLTTFTLKLTSDSWWRAGGDGVRMWKGEHEQERKIPGSDDRKDETDLAFTREPSICWDPGHNGERWVKPGDLIAEDYVLAGSSIRGALRHRTLFHWNRLNAQLFDGDAPETAASSAAFKAASEAPEPLRVLFGEVKVRKDGRDIGQRSALIVEDLVFQPKAVTAADHVKIDRFTGGATTGALFSEELVWTGNQVLELKLIVDTKLLEERLGKLNPPVVPDQVIKAFGAAVEDLCEDRLALGAKSGGFFKGIREPASTAEAAR